MPYTVPHLCMVIFSLCFFSPLLQKSLVVFCFLPVFSRLDWSYPTSYRGSAESQLQTKANGGRDNCRRSDEKRWKGISHQRLLNYSVAEAALGEQAATAEAAFISALQHTASTPTVELNLKAVPSITAPVSLSSDATVRRADAENQGSLISRNVTENKENLCKACVYIKANVKRVYSLGTDASSAAPAGLSDGAQRGFMASRPSMQ